MSDIAGEGMSHNDPLRDILEDLIAELRAIYDHDYGDDTYHPKNDLGIAIGNAVLRLREVGGDGCR